jgi:hypothetical protein
LVCNSCSSVLSHSAEEPVESSYEIALWLAGNSSEQLPNIPASYRWGLIHWWMKIHTTEVPESNSFIAFWHQWPQSFHNRIEERLIYNQEYSLTEAHQWRLKDLVGELLFNSINLPGRSLKNNLILRELFCYLENHLWENNGLIANLKLNAYEAALILNCDTEQIASMSEQGILVPIHRQKRDEPISLTAYLYHFGDVFCLWLAEFQTDEFNRSFYTSRW